MLIDANVFKGYFQMEIGKPHNLCGCPRQLLEKITSSYPVYYDSGRIIESEWRGVVDFEWFEVWLSSHLQDDSIQFLPTSKNGEVEKKLKNCGFPIGRDLVYIRLALSVVAKQGECSLYTEDIDFFDPTLKSCTAAKRLKTLRGSCGPVAKLLIKHGVNVECVP